MDYDEQFPIADDISLLQQALPDTYPSPPRTHLYLLSDTQELFLNGDQR